MPNICFVSSPDLILNIRQLLQGDCDQFIAQTRDRKKEFIAQASFNFIVFALSYVLLMRSVSGGFQDQELFSWLPYWLTVTHILQNHIISILCKEPVWNLQVDLINLETSPENESSTNPYIPQSIALFVTAYTMYSQTTTNPDHGILELSFWH